MEGDISINKKNLRKEIEENVVFFNKRVTKKN